MYIRLPVFKIHYVGSSYIKSQLIIINMCVGMRSKYEGLCGIYVVDGLSALL